MKVLIGVDGSSNSFAAVQFAARLVSPERDELILLYAAPGVSFAGDERFDERVLARARSTLSRAVFDEAIERLPAAWQARAERMEVAAAPGAALLEAVQSQSIDLVVVGFRGTSLFERFMLGSVTRSIVHASPVPVLVVKSEASEEEATEEPARAAEGAFQALVAFAGPDTLAERFAAVAGQFSWPPNARGSVMAVVQPMFLEELPEWLKNRPRDPDIAAMADAWRKEHEQMVAAARAQLEQFQQTLPDCFRRSAPIVVEGRPAEKILHQLDDAPFDLLIVGSGRSQGGPVSRLLVGSTSEQLLAKAPCSVLLVR